VIRNGPVSLIKAKCKEALDVLKPGGGFILSPGCALPVETPAEHMKAIVESAAEYGQY
jgi:uroporphyrinogen-III decarboxylase